MSRKSISVSEDVYHRLKALKQDDESWTDLGERAVDALESDDGAGGRNPNALTEDHIDDIASEVERRFERTLETATRNR